jgi:hypothetical protein
MSHGSMRCTTPTPGNPSDAKRGESTALEFKADSPEFCDLERKKNGYI